MVRGGNGDNSISVVSDHKYRYKHLRGSYIMDTDRFMQLAGLDMPLIEAVEIPEDVTFEQIEKMMDAAKRGLGLVNKLKSGEQKKKHASAVLSNMNKIRGALRRLIAAM